MMLLKKYVVKKIKIVQCVQFRNRITKTILFSQKGLVNRSTGQVQSTSVV